MAGLALRDRHALADDAANQEVRDLETDQIAPAEFAVDRQIEESEIAAIAGKLEPDADGPDMLGQEGGVFARGCGPGSMAASDGSELGDVLWSWRFSIRPPLSSVEPIDPKSHHVGTLRNLSCLGGRRNRPRRTSRVRFADLAVM
jgi:hypothetical protein